MTFEYILLVLMILLSAFFSGLEIALFSLGKAHVRSLVEHGVKGAKTVERLKRDPDRLLIVILIGNNVVNIGAASLATAVAIRLVGNVGVGIATGLMTLLILVFGEIAPKTYAVRWAEKIALKTAQPLRIFGFLVFPIAWLLAQLTRVITRSKGTRSVSDIEHETIVTSLSKMGLEEGKIDQHEHMIVESAFRLDRTQADRVMTPRSDMIAVKAGQTISEVVDGLVNQPHSRFPVYRSEKEGIIGILYLRDLYEQLRLGNNDMLVEDVAVKPRFIANTMLLNTLMVLFQRERIHMAVVLDEYGDTDGIVTFEDVLEELVGEIEDELDEVSQSVIKIGEMRYLVQASMNINDINRELDISLPTEDHNTLNGLLIDRFQNIPAVKDKISVNGYSFVIRQADARKVILVELTLVVEKIEDAD